MTPKQILEDQIKREKKGESEKNMRNLSEEEKESKLKGKKERKEKLVGKRENERKGEENLLVAKKSDIKQALFSQQNLLVLVYKEAMLNTNDLTSTLPSVVLTLLQEYEDIFPNEIPPGLPPIRGIEHQIDFIPGASLPNCPTYRTNLEEAKEIQKQVQELMDKGYVRESLSPCAVPVLLVPKKDGTWRMCIDLEQLTI